MGVSFILREQRRERSRRVRYTFFLLAALVTLLLYSTPSLGQSTLGTVVGTVKDASGDIVSGATVVLTNSGTSAKRTVMTDQSGFFSFVNLDPGIYQLTVEQTGFQKVEFPNLDLQSRETKRVDAALKIATQSQTVMVEDTAGAVVTTDVSNLSETKTGRELVDLPVAIFSRQNGSTSPISTLTTQPGVQTDDSGNLTIAGATPALLSYTIDGVSSVSVENSGPLSELFPSFNSIAEIRVGETNNNAEFSGVSDVTTTSKSGTNSLHGGIFENHEDAGLNSGNPFVSPKGKLVMNDFGGFLGGPVRVPKLYNGRDKTFFFLSYEGLRLAKAVPLVESVPTADMRAGNLCGYLGGKSIFQPNGTPIPCGSVPVSPVALNVLNTLYPAQNFGDSSVITNNFRENFPTPTTSNQGDIRIDHNLTSKHTMFARFTYKNREVTKAPSSPDCLALGFCSTLGSPSTGAFLVPEKDYGLTVAYNYVITPTLFNEVRTGFNTLHMQTTQNVNPAALLSQTGITGIPDIPTEASVPNFQVLGFQSTGGGNPSMQRSNIFQILDNLTWTKQKHTLKFGGDFRRMTDHDDNVFGSTRLGQYVFNGSSSVGAAVGDPFAQFLLGYPDYTVLSQVNNPNMNGLGYSYAFYGQDDWKVTPSFTLNFGLRWELHPPLKDVQYNTADFLPDWSGFVNGQAVHGAVVVPNAKGLTWTEPAFAASIAPTPILTAAQAGVPQTLRYTDKTDFGPRIGFAWRPFHNDKTVVRGGFGRFIESPLGFSLVSGWAVSASSVSVYNQAVGSDGVTPTLAFPSPFPSNLNVTGTQSFYYAFPVRYHDPSVEQWNLTFERDLGFGMGLRLSYTGSHGSNLETMVDLNQVPANTVGYTAASADRPYPIWGVLQSVYNGAESNYHNMTVDLKKRYARGFQFESSYSFTRDLSNEAGAVPNAFVGAGGNFLTDRFHPGLDYGNVIYDRRHRFLTTYLYELPLGAGKRFLTSSNGFVDRLVGGWEVAGVFLFQTGAFLTPSESSVDPAGTNITTTVGSTRPDVVSGVSPYAHGLTGSTGPVFLNPAAFALPTADGGRFGNASVGSVIGPGTQAVSMSLIKTVKFTESAKLQFGAEVANLLNHRNYEPPQMAIDNPNFGIITGLQTAEGAGPRNVQLTARFSF
jgi:Carboxypeptidase regulatory-like domain/TonB dependent receptor